MKIKTDIYKVKAYAPATTSNVAVGFDLLGFPLENIGDAVTLTRRKDNRIKISQIKANQLLPTEVKKNTASAVIINACKQLGIQIGFDIQITKGIPLGSGMGGSAASAVAALVAFNEFLLNPLCKNELAQLALFGEEIATGVPHPDNVVPCVFGGLTLTRSINPIDVIQLPIPKLTCTLVHPNLQLDTKDARKVLNKPFPLSTYVQQSANLASLIAALYTNNLQLLKKSSDDVMIEPRRATLVPNFYQVKQAGLKEGALAVSLSGSGPSMFALTEDQKQAKIIGDAMQQEFKKININTDVWISAINEQGAFILVANGF